MTARGKAELAAAVLALALAFYGFRTWLAERDARIRAEAEVSAAQKSFDQASDELKKSEQAQAARDAQTQQTIAKLAAAAAEERTPQQITQWIPSQLQLPAPVKVTAPEKGSAAPAVFEVPQVDLSYLRNDIATCQQNEIALAGAQDAVKSCRAQQVILTGQITDLEKQRDALQTELKGGTFWRRVKHDVKIGAGVALATAAALCGTGHCK